MCADTYVYFLSKVLQCQQTWFSVYKPLLAPENCEQEEVGEFET